MISAATLLAAMRASTHAARSFQLKGVRDPVKVHLLDVHELRSGRMMGVVR